jgi:hypothetical protein
VEVIFISQVFQVFLVVGLKIARLANNNQFQLGSPFGKKDTYTINDDVLIGKPEIPATYYGNSRR